MALYRRAIIQGLITAPLTAYLLPGDSLFKPLPNDLGKLTCSTSQGCEAPLMSEGVAPTQGLLVLQKKEQEWRHVGATETADTSCLFTPHPHLLPPGPCSGDKSWAQCWRMSPLRNRGPSGAEAILIKMSSEAPQGQCQNMFGRGIWGYLSSWIEAERSTQPVWFQIH